MYCKEKAIDEGDPGSKYPYAYFVMGALPMCYLCAPSNSHALLRSTVDEVHVKDGKKEVMRGPEVRTEDYDNDRIKTQIESIKQFVSRLPPNDKEKFKND